MKSSRTSMKDASISASASAYRLLRAGLLVNRIGFSQRLELRQSQALVMTPQLQQAIKMLQLSNLELNTLVETEIEQNPLLERGEREGEDRAASEGEAAEGGLLTNGAAESVPGTLAADGAPDAADHWHAAAGDEGD